MTPTEQDKELFELCKQVYEVTGWDKNETDDGFYWNQRYIYENYPSKGEWGTVSRDDTSAWYQHSKYVVAPLYTSDYLLEKLQEVGFNDGPSQGLVLEYVHKGHGIWGWKCHFPGYYYKYGNDEWIGFDPIVLKALLKLTLELNREKKL